MNYNSNNRIEIDVFAECERQTMRPKYTDIHRQLRHYTERCINICILVFGICYLSSTFLLAVVIDNAAVPVAFVAISTTMLTHMKHHSAAATVCIN